MKRVVVLLILVLVSLMVMSAVSAQWVKPHITVIKIFNISNDTIWNISAGQIVPNNNLPSSDVNLTSGLIIADGSELTGLSAGQLGISGSPWTSADNLMFNDSSTVKVGINTSNPLRTLHVVGDINVTGVIYVGTGTIKLNGSGIEFVDDTFQSTAFFPVVAAGWNSSEGNNTILLNISSLVGVGFVSPRVRLDVNGTVRADNVLPQFNASGSLGSAFLQWDGVFTKDLNASNVMVGENIFFRKDLEPRNVGLEWEEHFFKQGANVSFGNFEDVGDAFHMHHEESHTQGSVLLFLSTDAGVSWAMQSGDNLTANFVDRSLWVGDNRGNMNASDLLSCAIQADLENFTLRTNCDTDGDGADVIATGSVVAMRDLSYGRSFRGEGKFEVFNGASAALFSNFSLHPFVIQPGRTVVTGRAEFFVEDFISGDLGFFSALPSDGLSSRNWLADSTAPSFCVSTPCARAQGGNGGALRIMEANVSTLNLSLVRLNFSLAVFGFDASFGDNFSVFVKNGSSSDFDLVFNFTNTAGSVVPPVVVSRLLPDTVDNQSLVTLRFVMFAPQAAKAVYVDSVSLVGNVSGSATINEEFLHTEILLGDSVGGDDPRIFWNGTVDTLFLPNQTRVLGTLTVDDFVDLTPAYGGNVSEALAAVNLISKVDLGGGRFEVNHSSLPGFVRVEIPDNGGFVSGRSLGAMVSVLVESVQGLSAENDVLRSQLCLVNMSYSWCRV